MNLNIYTYVCCDLHLYKRYYGCSLFIRFIHINSMWRVWRNIGDDKWFHIIKWREIHFINIQLNNFEIRINFSLTQIYTPHTNTYQIYTPHTHSNFRYSQVVISTWQMIRKHSFWTKIIIINCWLRLIDFHWKLYYSFHLFTVAISYLKVW